MDWHNEPPSWSVESGRIVITTGAKTDFWRKTHYGFIRDNGHFYGEPVSGDFTAEVKVTGQYGTLYDQAGLMVRQDETTWMKCGVEFVNGIQHASVVITRDYSDWSVTRLPENPPSIWLRVKREGSTLEIFYSLDGSDYIMLRTGHLTAAPVTVGVMAASPEGEGFTATFDGFSLSTPAEGNGTHAG